MKIKNTTGEDRFVSGFGVIKFDQEIEVDGEIAESLIHQGFSVSEGENK